MMIVPGGYDFIGFMVLDRRYPTYMYIEREIECIIRSKIFGWFGCMSMMTIYLHPLRRKNVKTAKQTLALRME